jgi:hypothetical protein
MPELLDPTTTSLDAPQDDHDALRLLNRSPHPYHRQNFELLEPADSFPQGLRKSILRATLDEPSSRAAAISAYLPESRESTPTSDSGTEADDEHFLKGLPAPRAKLHKGLRGHNEVLSGTATPVLSSTLLEEDEWKASHVSKKDATREKTAEGPQHISKRNRVIARRLIECILLGCLGAFVRANGQVRPVLHKWRSGWLYLLP